MVNAGRAISECQIGGYVTTHLKDGRVRASVPGAIALESAFPFARAMVVTRARDRPERCRARYRCVRRAMQAYSSIM